MNEPRKPTTPIVVQPKREETETQSPSKGPPDCCAYGCFALVVASGVLVLIGVLRRLVAFAFW